MEGVLAALEDRKLAVERGEFRSYHAVDIVDPVQEAKAAVAGIRPLRIEVDQRRSHLGFAVGMDGAVALVEQAAQRHQGRVLAKVVDTQPLADGAGECRSGHVFDQRVDGRATVARVVREKAGAGIVRKVAIQVTAHFIGQLAVRHHERKGLLLNRGIRAIKSGGIEQDGSAHGTFNSIEMWPSVALTEWQRWRLKRAIQPA